MVRNIFKKGINAFTSKQTNIFSAAFFISLTTVISQVLGFLKYRFLVSIFGASQDLGVFFASFKIPDFLFQVLIAGALSSAFIPIFSEYLAKEERQEAYKFTSSLITIGLAAFIVFSIIISIFSYPLSSMIAPGFSQSQLNLMSNLTRIILLSQIFFVLGTVATGVLQSLRHFLIPGIAAAFYNVGIIIGLVLLGKVFGIFGATFGVLLGSMLFFLIQVPMLKKGGFEFKPLFSLEKGVLKVFHLMIPRSLTLLIVQFAIMTNVFFASFISPRGYSFFELAQTLALAPVVLFGQSIAQASFPALSFKKEDMKEFLYIFHSSFMQILYLTLPISAILIVLRIPVVRLFYGASTFDWEATISTGMTLSFFSISIFAQALSNLLLRAFYALKDTKTPLFITLFSVVVNVFFSYLFILVYRLPIYFLALSFTIGQIVYIALLIGFFDRKIRLPKMQIIFNILKIIIASTVMGLALYIPIKLLDRLVFDTTRTINLLFLTGIASVLGVIAYIFFTWLLDIKEAYYIIQAFKKFGNWRRTIGQVGEIIDEPKQNV